MSGKLLFYYFGDDEAYFRALQGEFRKHARVPIDFQRLHADSESKIQSYFLKIFSLKPACVFIDFSKHTQDYLHLARIISRTSLEHQLLMVGLVDYLSPPEVLRESIATGTNLNFIKSAETFDVAFSVTKLVAPNAIGEHGFANASLKEDFEAGVLCKVGYVQNEGIHIETDHTISKGDRLILQHHWLEKRIVPSRHVFVKNVTHANMFYQFKLNADLEFLFVDDFIPAEGMDEETVKQKSSEREDLVHYHKKQLKKWMDDNQNTSSEKRAKVLVVDYNFHFYQMQPRTDKHAYTIRCIPNFSEIAAELDRLRPQIIAYELQPQESAKNNLANLKLLVSTIGSMKLDPSPFIIVFSAPGETSELREALNYPQVIAHKEEISPELVIKMADVLQKKLATSNSSQREEAKVFLKKTHASSLAEIQRTVTLIKISETDMVLQSDYPFAAGTNLHFTKPVEMFVNLQPAAKPSGKVPEYDGLIHCLGETDKKELRRFVNSIFFRDHDAQVTAETDEYKKLNELKLQEKVALALKAREEAEAKAQDEAESIAPDKIKEPEAG